MGTTIVFIVAAVIVVSVFAMLISLRMSVAKAAKRNGDKKHSPQQAYLIWADAVVVSSQSDSSSHASRVRVSLTLDVYPPDAATLRVNTAWFVNTDALHLIQTGCHVPVKLNSSKQTVVPAAAWASTAAPY